MSEKLEIVEGKEKELKRFAKSKGYTFMKDF